jgi:hypothetical protein
MLKGIHCFGRTLAHVLNEKRRRGGGEERERGGGEERRRGRSGKQ